uniref:Urease accessory protein UreD n=1 Tax=Aureoumbra lagunensis TaxID=44058 RepID=A0A7S3NGY8_9STRA|mmetsp:Transcript_13747/g.20508  ORF Transcript_13747/g.20508 Transcript_13747/m.20508 type:complete len:578 (+) Transcript_13747:34-1767(+)
MDKKIGVAKIEMNVVLGRTVLSKCIHRNPLRIQPMPRASACLAGSASAVISSLGGGLLGCDEVQVDVSVGPNAKGWLGTQSSTKIYKKDPHNVNQGTRSCLKVKVAAGGMLVWAPDALVPYKDSIYRSKSSFEIDASAHFVSVEWTQSGRAHSGERWELGFYETISQWHIVNGGSDIQQIRDATRLKNAQTAQVALDLGGQSRDVFGTVALYNVPLVAKRFDKAARAAATRRGARIHHQYGEQTNSCENPSDVIISGLAAMGISPCLGIHNNKNDNPFLLVRFVAFDVEGAYRILHWCLAPLKTKIGFAPYSDRIHARGQTNHLNRFFFEKPNLDLSPPPNSNEKLTIHLSPLAFMLADSALPTGGFAHSGGLEAALQMGILRPNDETTLLQVISNLAMNQHSLYAPFAFAAMQQHIENYDDFLMMLDENLDALLCSHAQAHLASTRQGAALNRICNSMITNYTGAKLRHGAIAFGVLAKHMALSAEAMLLVFVHTAIRDAFSAAVRLGIIGPLAALPLQAKVFRHFAHTSAISHVIPYTEKHSYDDDTHLFSASSAPFLDALHASHSLLDMRLFQS